MSYALKEAMAGLGRTKGMGLISVATTAVSLLVFGGLLLTLLSLYGLVTRVKSRVQIEIYLSDAANREQIQGLKRKLEVMPEVKNVLYVDKERAAVEFQKTFGEGFLDAVSRNPLPASLRVTLKSGYRSSEKIAKIVKAVEKEEAVEEIEYGRQWVEKLDRLTYILSVAAILVTLVVGAASIFVISNTVNFTILARRDSIEIMRLVGATDSFIQAPFLLEGIIGGTLGGAIAAALLYLVHRWIRLRFPSLIFAPQTELAAWLMIPLGTILGGLGSRLAVRRVLKHLP
ncbi:MAG: hypothetical protein B1H40_02735 [Candidatus Latescibacteria bacterium 4484_181]|nr:MAG: hypothetical protein B1H40_02735 [Candidatus Latescibacteria bacterium 4484_181]RKY65920.1 MAG: hypothetical protein DRQ02_09580 [Candidatus Latescibacterota bacterium]RKY73044.1 MAG: hypothetical protein DRQ24_03490 [Candidatus Latescibacterota bacterium]